LVLICLFGYILINQRSYDEICLVGSFWVQAVLHLVLFMMKYVVFSTCFSVWCTKVSIQLSSCLVVSIIYCQEKIKWQLNFLVRFRFYVWLRGRPKCWLDWSHLVHLGLHGNEVNNFTLLHVMFDQVRLSSTLYTTTGPQAIYKMLLSASQEPAMTCKNCYSIVIGITSPKHKMQSTLYIHLQTFSVVSCRNCMDDV
jgi:hypothetical protein